MVASKHDVRGQIAALLGEVRRDIDVSRNSRIYCNRHLRMDSIELVGFDMDYTLALYQQGRLEQLSIEKTLEKLVAKHNYPEEILSLTFDSSLAIRGLVIDKNSGNILKMDRHSMVGRVYHGTTLLSKEERNKLYRANRIRLSSARYAWIDTLFALPDAVMYMTLVDFFDRTPHGLKPTYNQLFDHIRECIDEAHADGSLKKIIRADLPRYIVKDLRLAEMLHKLRSSGKKLFLLTNSYFEYSNDVMAYLLDGERKAYPSWRQYFDVVIVGGKKPGFFADRTPFLELDPKTGRETGNEVQTLSRDYVYQGGNIFDFQDMSGVSGDKVLYVGDHIYGDILRLRKAHTWRTAMVLQELSAEYQTGERFAQERSDLEIIDRRRRNLDSEIDYQVLMLKQLSRLVGGAEPSLRAELEEARQAARDSLDSLRSRKKMYVEEVGSLDEKIARAYNAHWGAMFTEGHDSSRFGQQVADYADLYTSRASNFLSYSPLRYFRAPRKLMPHEV